MALAIAGDSESFGYTGGVQSITLTTTGVYKLEVYGASGGYSSAGGGGKGGYSVGYKILNAGTTVYIVVGGQGNGWSGSSGGAGGYNGGGKGGNGNGYSGAGGGGGATHIALVGGTLAEIGKETFDEQGLIVAGGGGGYERNSPGTGGGLNGGNGAASNGAVVPGGTQTTGYAFGQGQDGRNATSGNTGGEGNGGGGGGYFGGTAYQATGAYTDASGGGGSGFIGNVDNATTSNGVRTGHGQAIITLMINTYISLPGSGDILYEHLASGLYSITAAERNGYEFIGWELDGYTQLEYIESTGTQYIDTEIIPQFNNFEIRISDFCVTNYSETWEDYFGCATGDATSDGFQFRRNAGNSILISSMGVYSNSPHGNYKYSYTLGTTINEVKILNGVLYINGVIAESTGLSGSQSSPTLPLYIFCRLLGSSPERYSKIKFSRFVIIKNDVLVRDFIPAVRHSDGAIGLLDLVNLKFYSDAAGGNFIGGDPV